MLVSLVLAGVTLRRGLVLRGLRRLGRRRDPALRRAHLRLARPTLALLLVGFAGGPISAVWLRGFEAFSTAHAFVSSLALALFLATGVLGRRLETGRSRALDLHAGLGIGALFAGCGAFGSGFVLLP